MLACYNWSKPVIVQTDTRKYSLNVALIQYGRPITFASRTLTNIKTCYANIERVCLSVYLSLEKLHTYLQSRHVIIENNLKPLEMIQHKPIHAASPRLDYMLLHMKKCHYTIQYKPGKNMNLANHLSQFPSAKESLPIPIHQNIQHVQLCTHEVDAVQRAIEHNPVYSTLYWLTLRRWSNHLWLILRIAQHYCGAQDELSIEATILLMEIMSASLQSSLTEPLLTSMALSRDWKSVGPSLRSNLLARHRCQHC